MILGSLIAAALLGGLVGYLVGFRAGDLRSRSSWDEKNEAEVAAWQDGVRFGQHLEQNKADLGL